MTSSTREEYSGLEIAVIGMAGRFPGAPDLAAYWRNLTEGRESIRRWSHEELIALGLSAEHIEQQDFVRAGAPLEEADRFDASFFGYSPGEAEILDPQQRLFLECAWQALETAGYSADSYRGAIGVYASSGMNTYLFNLRDNARIRESVSRYELFVANDKDFLATRTAFKLNLRGPGVTVQTACSSSLVAIHMAVQSLLAGECDMALAGGVGLSWQYGYQAREGGILSADGHCRAFDAKAAGTVPGSGVGVVTLKRLEDALADGDTIDAIIRGSAINNDGGLKASFTAPQVDSQAAVIAAAQDAAGISADTVGYVEAHGTGTPLGDPIELAALNQAFRRHTDRRGYCALGSVKTNIGHLDTAAGVAGFIKAVLMLRHRKLPPSLHFEAGNPQIDFAASPFIVNDRLRDWEAAPSLPRRAGVSSFGIGGTNAHLILEEAPASDRAADDTSPQLLLLSARNPDALGETVSALASHLEGRPHASLADVAHTLREGRRAFTHRQAIVASSAQSAAAQLRALGDFSAASPEATPPAVFLFPGQGSQHAAMGRELHAGFPAFREHFDACAERLDELLGRDFRQALFAGTDEVHRTELAQPALFAMEYALAQAWSSFGVAPRAMHGHSIGEYVAACLSGVFDLDTALRLVAERGRLMQQAPAGAMLAIMHPDGSIDEWLGDDIALAAVNAPGVSVVAGPADAIGQLRDRLEKAGLAGRPVRTSHAFHSPMMRDAAMAFREIVAGVRLNAPAIPVISNVTGDWLTEKQATDPSYWADHLLGTVRFSQGTQRLLSLGDAVFIEMGPGNALSTLTALQAPANARIIPALGNGDGDEAARLLAAAGKYWQAGGRLSSPRTGARRRVPLPTYPFQRQRFWVDPDGIRQATGEPRKGTATAAGPTLYRPSWHRLPPAPGHAGRGRWFICDDGVIGGALAGLIERGGGDAYRATPAAALEESGYRGFTVPAHDKQGLRSLLRALEERDASPDHIVYLWPLADHAADDAFDPAHALQWLIDAVAAAERPLSLTVVTRGTTDVTGDEALDAAQAATAGLLEVIDQEYPWVSCRLVDLEPGSDAVPAKQAEWLRDELGASERIVARRGTHRWALDFATHRLPESAARPPRLRQGGVFVIVGNIAEGLGRIWSHGLASIQGSRIAWLHDIGAPDCPAPAGVELVEHRIDCADPIALGAALTEIDERWGRIDGVFLSISLISPEAIAPLAIMERNHWAFNRRSTVEPVRALAEALGDRRIGFCCIQSSLSTVVGGFGLGAYAAGYREAEMLAASQSRGASCTWLVVNYALNHSADDGERHVANPFAVEADVAWDVTRGLIEAGWGGQFAIAHGELDRQRNRIDLHDSPVEAGRNRRPDLPIDHVAPRNEVEATVVNILEELLGIDGIGVEDGFFELGGHSLLAIRVVARLRQAFPVDVEMRELLFENPTAAGIAQAIAARLPQASELDAMAALLAEVEGLSDQQVRKQIAGAGGQ